MATSPASPSGVDLPALLGVSIDETLGCILIGFAASCVVFGVLCMQCVSYFRRYPLDRPMYKYLVALICGIELVDQALIGHLTYFYLVSNFLTPLNIITGDVAWSLIVQVNLGALVGTIVKLCFAMRVWRFSNRNIFVTGIIVLLTLGQFGLSIAYTVRAFQLRKLVLADQLKLIASFSLGAGALTDIFTAAALSYFLRRLRTGFKQSDSLVNGLTRYAINTGALTSAVSIATVLAYDLKPKAFIFLAFYFVLSKLYAISFICTLNTRRIVRGRGTDRQGVTSATAYTSNHGGTHGYRGEAFFMVSQHTRSNIAGGPAGLKSPELEIGVRQEVSVVSDVEEYGGFSPARGK